MYHYIGNSSGETSGYLTYDLLFNSGIDRDRILVCFQNTGEEDEASLEFLHEQEKQWGVEYLWLEYDFPQGFGAAILGANPTYENLEKYGFKGMYNTDLLDEIRWREDELKVSPKQKKKMLKEAEKLKEQGANTLFDVSEYEVLENVGDYSRCLKDFYALFGKTRVTLGKRYREVNFETADREGMPMLRILLYLNAIRYVKRLPWVVPNPAQRFSTGNLKVKPADNYLDENDLYPVTKYLGIRSDEESRYWGLMREDSKRAVTVSMPLFERGIDEAFIREFWDKQPFQLAIRDKKYLGNCKYCYLKTRLKRIRAAQERPDSFWRLKTIEDAAGDSMRREQSASKTLEAANMMVITDTDLLNDTEKQMSCMCG